MESPSLKICIAVNKRHLTKGELGELETRKTNTHGFPYSARVKAKSLESISCINNSRKISKHGNMLAWSTELAIIVEI